MGSKILGEAGKQEILQQIIRKFKISNRLPNRYFPENCRRVPLTSESAVATYQSLGALRDTMTNSKGECFFHGLDDPVFKSLSRAIKEAIFGKLLLVYLETIRQVAKIDQAQGQIQYSNTCTQLFFQNLFSSSYFLSWQRFLR